MLVFRNASMDDLDNIYELEKMCFVEAEAASKETIRNRLEAFPECFWLLEKDSILVSCINGMASNQDTLVDSMFHDVNHHVKNGPWQMLFGVCTHKNYQKQSYGTMLMNHVIEDCRMRGQKGIVLTCKEIYVPYYEKFQFKNQGYSTSTHGGAKWYQMSYKF